MVCWKIVLLFRFTRSYSNFNKWMIACMTWTELFTLVTIFLHVFMWRAEWGIRSKKELASNGSNVCLSFLVLVHLNDFFRTKGTNFVEFASTHHTSFHVSIFLSVSGHIAPDAYALSTCRQNKLWVRPNYYCTAWPMVTPEVNFFLLNYCEFYVRTCCSVIENSSVTSNCLAGTTDWVVKISKKISMPTPPTTTLRCNGTQ